MLGNFTTKENTAAARRSYSRAIKVSSSDSSSAAYSLSLGKSFAQYLPVCPSLRTVSGFLFSCREVSAIMKYINGLKFRE
jgi:hypothetical protein